MLRYTSILCAILLATATGTASAADTGATTTTTDATEAAWLEALSQALASPTPTGRGDTQPPPAASARALNPAISAILDVAAVLQDTAEPLPGGNHDPGEEGFVLEGLEFSIQGAVDPYFQLNLRPVIGGEGLELEEAYGEVALPGGLGLRAGEFLVHVGRSNRRHPHQWNLSHQPLMLTRLFGPDGNHGLGVELSGWLPVPFPLELGAAATRIGGAETAASFVPSVTGVGSSEALPLDRPSRLQTTLWLEGFHALSSAWSVTWTLDGLRGPAGAGTTEIGLAAIYLRYRPRRGGGYRAWGTTAELYGRRVQWPGGERRDTGGYLESALRWAQRWRGAVRAEYLGPIVADGEVVADPTQAGGVGERYRLGAAVDFLPTEFSRLRWELVRDLPSWRAPYWRFVLGLELVAGAHGAHAY